MVSKSCRQDQSRRYQGLDFRYTQKVGNNSAWAVEEQGESMKNENEQAVHKEPCVLIGLQAWHRFKKTVSCVGSHRSIDKVLERERVT